MARRIVEKTEAIESSGIELAGGMPICQVDLPVDWYQKEFRPYAEEYIALRDRTPETVLPWMDSYITPALQHFGPDLKLLAHYYMGGEIVKLVERYGGSIADSYLLAKQAVMNPECSLFVESAVHFMAESIAILKHDHQKVYITNPKAGCTMEMLAKEEHVEPAFEWLKDRYGDDLVVVCYMNTSGRIKALAGRTGGSVCTSSNATKVVRHVRQQGKRIFFVPDLHLGENTADALGMDRASLFHWKGGREGADYVPAVAELDALDRAEMILWGSFCGVHTIFQPRFVDYWKSRGYGVHVHPECPIGVVQRADGSGSTSYLWKTVMNAPAGARLAIGTEGHFVRNVREQALRKGIEVVHLAEIPEAGYGSFGCGCATMSRNDPPHLVALLDLMRQDKAPELNLVMVGDAVDERTGVRERLDSESREEVRRDARAALESMIAITESPG